MYPKEKILGLSFFAGEEKGLLLLLEKGGLLTAPAAPALVNLGKDTQYTEALLKSDFVITDSGLMILIWWVIKGRWVPKLSGLKLLKAALAQTSVKETGASFWVKPSQKAQERSMKYLNNHGFSLKNEDFHTAPMYQQGSIEDPPLVEILNNKRPPYIFINIGGGKQEVLGLYLKKHLNYSPAILCTGAAIAFLTGEQVHIPTWADRLSIGWLFRCLSQPRIFVKRYLKALRLIPILLHYREQLPLNDAT